jgi:hypothetical protein
MSSREFAEWRAYSTLEPFGEEISNWRAGMLASVIASVFGGKKSKAFQPQDFYPVVDQPKQADPDAMLRKIEMLNAAFGGDDLRPKT